MGSARSVRTRRSKKSKRETTEPRKEVIAMWNTPSEDRLSKIPRLYETEHISLKEKLIYLHFFIGGCDWYIAEFDGEDLFWGFVILNDDFQNAEWGYISLSELKSINVGGWLEVDCEFEEFWRVRKACEIQKIRKAHGWVKIGD
jgi:hypothetical protein